MLKNLSIIFILSSRNVLRNPRRSILTLLAISFGLAGTIVVSSLARGLSYNLAKDTIDHLTGHIQIHAENYLEDPDVSNSISEIPPKLEKVMKSPQILKKAERVRVPGIVMSERESYGVMIVGINPKEELGLSFIAESVNEGKFFDHDSDDGIIIGRKLLELLQTDIGKRVVVMSQDVKNEISDKGVRIIGVFDSQFESTEKSFVFLSIKKAQGLLGLDAKISEISLVTKDYENLEPTLSNLQSSAPNLDVRGWRDIEKFVSALLDIQGKFLIFWFCIVVIAISFGIVNTLFMAIYERIREFGMLQALGMKPIEIQFQVLIESLLLILIGGFIGNILSVIGIHLLESGIDISAFAEGAKRFGIKNVIYPRFVSHDWITANLLVLFLGSLSSFYPAWRASRFTPANAISRAT
ncbi:MAG: ABC transporter permease [Deltaproteobacteria bacterium]|nr:ABC transporter permease [Deltaproteobacteria bacterium]